MRRGLYMQEKSLNYMYKQSAKYYDTLVNRYKVYFVDTTASTSDMFGSQDLITVHPPLEIPVVIKSQSLEYTLDRFGIEELPEAIAVFSVGWMKQLGFPEAKTEIAPDTLIQFNKKILYRVSKSFPENYIANSPSDFLYWECLLERATRNNYLGITDSVFPEESLD